MQNLKTLAETAAQLQAEWTARWHESSTPPQVDPLLAILEQNHRHNFDLWHEEDVARRDDLGSERVHQAKRAIDRFNQARNDAIERLDEWLLNRLPPMPADGPLHSETPGMILDRLSILSLKIFHMEIEATRTSATVEHRAKSLEKLTRLQMQLADLQNCLHELLAQVGTGSRRFKIYRQMKMYNDASFNPQLYARNQSGGK
jgi:hypothetical protein